ncbi:HNH endonuclease [Achromobacter anxifer]|uniref:HNH endonuclease n=1 Tax=Achromobacter anxifer TaxID=1287737 RepID=UPI0021583658|nr:HNH endonuclease [Achromobacter anxifer]
MLVTKEHYDLLAQFEREHSGRFDKEAKEFWPRGIIYQDGRMNELFLSYRRGYAYAVADYRSDLQNLEASRDGYRRDAESLQAELDQLKRCAPLPAQEVEDLTAEKVRELLDYDPSTGLLYWRKTRTGTALAGTLAGSPHPDGYVQIKIKDKPYLAHRLAWLITTGKWPTELIDHRDGDRTNNRLINLRDVSPSVNQENRRSAPVNNKTGFLGVSRKGKRWEAKIRANGKKISLGRFDTPEAAHAAYVSAKRVLHRGCTI